jgi:hypothetical protein
MAAAAAASWASPSLERRELRRQRDRSRSRSPRISRPQLRPVPPDHPPPRVVTWKSQKAKPKTAKEELKQVKAEAKEVKREPTEQSADYSDYSEMGEEETVEET